jgi:hypothetical protein
MLLTIIGLCIALLAVYYLKKFKKTEKEYFDLHNEYLQKLNENEILKNKINDLQSQSISKTIKLSEEVIDYKNDKNDTINPELMTKLINEFNEEKSLMESELKNEIKENEIKENEMIENELLDYNKLNYSGFKLD